VTSGRRRVRVVVGGDRARAISLVMGARSTRKTGEVRVIPESKKGTIC